MNPIESEDYVIIFRKSFRTKTGKVIYAASYGKEAFKIKIKKSKYKE